MACQIKSFTFSCKDFFFFFFLPLGAVLYYLQRYPRLFSSLFLQAKKIPWLKQRKVFYFALNIPGSSMESDGVRWTTVLQEQPSTVAESSASVSVFKMACASGPGPTAPPPTYQRSASTVVLPPGKHSMGDQSHQQQGSLEKMNVAVLNQPKMQRNKAYPFTEREGGKEWAKPESSGVLPKPLEACDRSLFYLPPEK